MQLVSAQPEYIDISEIAGLIPDKRCVGIAVGDFNNDGYDDFYVSFLVGKNQLYKNKGDGTFEEIGEVSGVALPDSIQTETAVWGDINNDGWVDLYIGNNKTSDQLFLNLGNEQFQNITHSAGINSPANSKSVNMADVNRDGFLDIYVSNFFSENILYLNQGDNTFQDVTLEAGALDEGQAMGTVFFDYDKDGDQDIYLVHDGRTPNFLYQNNEWALILEISIMMVGWIYTLLILGLIFCC